MIDATSLYSDVRQATRHDELGAVPLRLQYFVEFPGFRDVEIIVTDTFLCSQSYEDAAG